MRAGAVLLLLFVPAGAVAEEVLPFVARVTGVAPGDVLEVRDAPSAEARDIGDLPPGPDLVEVTALDPSGRWGRIVWGEGDGWVALRFLARAERPQVPGLPLPAGLRCLGTEPFWTLDLREAGAVLSRPEGAERSFTIGAAQVSANLGDHAVAFSAGPLTGVLRRAACTDGMSDRSYGWSLDLLGAPDGGEPLLLSGCCLLSRP